MTKESANRAEQGLFVTMEGIDGSGKSTQLGMLAENLRSRGLDICETREPGGTEIGECLREIILHNAQSVCDNAELLLLFAARAQHIAQVIQPALQEGRWVLCDRFTDATFAYQGGGRGIQLSIIEKLESMVQGDFRPDCTLLLDVPAETSAERTSGRGNSHDRIEMLDLVFKQRVRQTYLDRQLVEPTRIFLIDGLASIASVQEEICRIVNVLDSRLPDDG